MIIVDILIFYNFIKLLRLPSRIVEYKLTAAAPAVCGLINRLSGCFNDRHVSLAINKELLITQWWLTKWYFAVTKTNKPERKINWALW